jgi:hypothetical protein
LLDQNVRIGPAKKKIRELTRISQGWSVLHDQIRIC